MRTSRLSLFLLLVGTFMMPFASNGNIVSHAPNAPTKGISVSAVVFNKKGEVITGLNKQHFGVFLDGVRKDIIDFNTPAASLEASIIVEYRRWGMAIDNQGSVGLEVTPYELFRTTDILLSQLLRSPEDQTSVVEVDMRPQFLTDLTSDPKRLSEAVNLLRNNRPAFAEVALFDTLKLILAGGTSATPVLPGPPNKKFDYRGLANSPSKRKAIIAITSGLDTTSKTKFNDVRRIVQDAGIPIHVICIIGTLDEKVSQWRQDKRQLGRLPTRKDLEEAEQRMNAITVESGGTHHHYINMPDGSTLIGRIQGMVSGQYNLSFRADDIRDGKPHQIEVKIDADGDGVFDEGKFVVQATQVFNAPRK